MPNLQAILYKSNDTTETLSSMTSNDAQHEICLVSDSPHYIVRVRFDNYLFSPLFSHFF
jgi:hypothetical protein